MAASDRPGANPVARENAREGTRAWMLEQPYRRLHGDVRSAPIEGYASCRSAVAGEAIELFISADPEADVLVEVFRSGFYAGAGGHKVAELGPVRCGPQPTPAVGEHRLRVCAWEPSLTVTVGEDWLSGVYLCKLTELGGGLQSYVVFIVRDGRECELLLGCADLTWQAYNHWPDLFSLYNDGYRAWYNGPGVAVSSRRPYGKYPQIVDRPDAVGSGEWLLWEFPIAYWLEREGVDVSYQSGVDLHRDAGTLSRANGYLSVGHDEYYTREMFDGLRSAIAGGMNAGFLCGNSMFGRIEFLDEALTALHRVDCFGQRPAVLDKEIAEFPWTSPDANAVMGSGLSMPVVGIGDWTICDADYWIFADTGMRDGDRVEGLVGWEYHGSPAAIPGLRVVAGGPTDYVDHGVPLSGEFAATVYEGRHGNTIFNAATCWWGDALSAPPGHRRPQPRLGTPGPDPRVETITRNVVARLRERRWPTD